MRTLTTRNGKSVNTPYSDQQALGILRENYGKLSSFGLDMVGKERHTPETMTWVHILAVELMAPKVDQQRAAAVELKAILALLTNARSSKLKNPAITFEWNGRTVELKLAGSRATRPGTINVTDGGPYGQNVWYGRINLTGVFEGSRSADANVLNILIEFNENPVRYAAEYGRKTGRCCFCHLYLTDARSTAVGYGPTCAKHYGMPWGAAAADEVLQNQIADFAAEQAGAEMVAV